MKIGILTFHRAINYGAVLQAYALQEVLYHLNHEAYVIDYRQPKVERNDRRPFLSGDKMRLLKGGHLRSWWQYDANKNNALLRRRRFDDYLHNYLRLTDPCHESNIPDMDVYIIGSDQVWNSSICDGLDSVFWGTFSRPNNSRIISYAASTSVKDLEKHNTAIIQDLLMNFSKISVREQETCEFLNKTYELKNKVQTVLDPTLLAKPSVWDSFDDDQYRGQEYVLYFGARRCETYPMVLLDKAESLAKQYGCTTKRIDFNTDSPVDFINKFRYAKAVVSSSFHGVAFSLIFNKPLYAVQYGDEQDSRYVNVLKSVGAEEMLVDLHQEVYLKSFDYEQINQRMAENRIKSIEYLKSL